MEKILSKTPAARFLDHLLRLLATSLAGIAWFVYLWGLSLPALASGLALAALIWLCMRQFGKKLTRKREKQMRRLIGGELALQNLLLLSPKDAACEAAQWLMPRFPVEPEQTLDWGVMGTLNGERVLIRLIAQHESLSVTAQQVVECAREMRALAAQRCLLCLTAPVSREALGYIETAESPIELISREALIQLAGLRSPATDEQLSRLARRRRVRRTAGQWLSIILEPSRARRYFWYGIGLSALAVATGLPVYPIPAVLCLCLFVASKLHRA